MIYAFDADKTYLIHKWFGVAQADTITIGELIKKSDRSLWGRFKRFLHIN